MHTFAFPLQAALKIAADKTAVIDDDRAITYTELHERCRQLAGGLRALGLKQGDRVAILAANSGRYIET